MILISVYCAYLSNYLNAFSGHEFYLGRLGYYHWRSQKDVIKRIDNYKKIFLQKQNSSCEEALSTINEIGITHLIVNRKTNNEIISCKNWAKQSKGDWTVIDVKND